MIVELYVQLLVLFNKEWWETENNYEMVQIHVGAAQKALKYWFHLNLDLKDKQNFEWQ